MGRRPIIIPRHQALRRTDQGQQQYHAHDANARDSLLKADSLAHPLAFLEDEESPNDSFGSSSGNSGNSGCVGSIGIRRHGQKQQHRHQSSTPEKKNRTRVVRKRSPTSVLLPLEFIEEEGEEEEEQDPKTVKAKRPESVVSDIAVLGGLRGHREEGLSDSFFDENSIFGSIIEEVNESNDFGHDLVLPSDDADFAPSPSSPSSMEDQSTGTFGEMMLQQNHEMKYQQEREEMAARQQQEEDQMTSMLTTSSIHSTSTLERSLEVKKGHFFKIEHPDNNKRQNNSSVNRKKETTFQRLLKSATQCHQRSESRNTISSDNSTVKQRNSASVMRHQLPETISSRKPLLLSPEEQRKVALAKYRHHQNIHITKAKQKTVDSWNEFPNNSFQSETLPQVSIDREPSIEPKGRTADDNPHISVNQSALDDSFASIDDELRSLRNQTLRSNASFRLAESCLSNDLQESESLVKDLEEQLRAAKEQRDLCRERYELAKGKREKEKELTAIQTLHLEILDCSGKNERSRSMLVERHEHEMSSPSLARKRDNGILGPIFFTGQEQGSAFGKTSARDDASLETEVGTDLASGSENNNLSHFENRYADKSIEDLWAIKNRLEAIKDLFDKARYMVSDEFSSSPAEMLRRQHQSLVMIETAASKYILFRIKNLI